jgi:hypothetical protein
VAGARESHCSETVFIGTYFVVRQSFHLPEYISRRNLLELEIPLLRNHLRHRLANMKMRMQTTPLRTSIFRQEHFSGK